MKQLNSFHMLKALVKCTAKFRAYLEASLHNKIHLNQIAKADKTAATSTAVQSLYKAERVYHAKADDKDAALVDQLDKVLNV